MKFHWNFNDFFECVKNFRYFINFNRFGVGGVTKNAEIIFEKAPDFSSQGVPGQLPGSAGGHRATVVRV